VTGTQCTVYIEAVRPNSEAKHLSVKVEYVKTDNSVNFLTQWAVNAIQDLAPLYGDSANSPGGVAYGADGGNPMAAGYSGAVRYADGTVAISSTDVASSGWGYTLAQTRTWTNDWAAYSAKAGRPTATAWSSPKCLG